MPYLIIGTITAVIGAILLMTDNVPFIAAFILAAGIIISFIGSTRLKKKGN